MSRPSLPPVTPRRALGALGALAGLGVLAALAALALPTGSSHAQARGAATATSPSSPRIVVGPEVLVSHDGDVPHVETMIAANPTNRHNLLGGSITGGRAGGGVRCKTYASHDGGQTWVDRSFPELERYSSADPQVAFTPRGTAIFTCLSLAPDETGRTRGFLYAWRSEDGGLTWSAKPANLGVSYDHEMLIVDQTGGPFSGRIYLSALHGAREYTLSLFRSEDDGRTWIGPVKFTDGGPYGVNTEQMAIFSDGDLLVTWTDFPIVPSQFPTWKEFNYWTALSKDGGVTFTKPRKVTPAVRRMDRSNPDGRYRSAAQFAVDHSDQHRDRLYVLWTDVTPDGPRTMLARSDDKGATWSAPKLVDPTTPKGAKQHQARLAVNREGTIGISYFDTRGVEGEGWHEYFTASVDGGDTFLPPVRVSTEPSRPGGPGNLRLEPMASGNDAETAAALKGRITLSLTSGVSRWPTGGDYMGLTADSLGHFHPLWPDARTGTYQLWTARIRVERPPRPLAPHPLDEILPPLPPAPAPVAPTSAPVDVSSRVALTFDPAVENAATGELELRVRVKNVSPDSIFGPLRAEVKAFGGPLDRELLPNAPAILNAANGRQGVGAVIDLTPALGSERVLPPGGQSGATLIRLKLVDPRRTPGINLDVTGVLRGGS